MSENQSETADLYFLGPVGSFTHEAALKAAQKLKKTQNICARPVPADTAADVFESVCANKGCGIIAWENNVEGCVVPNLDALIDSSDAVAVSRISVHVAFDAFVREDHERLTNVTAHPHGLAQCRNFARKAGLKPVPAKSNAAGCRDLAKNTVALAARICGEIYGLETLERSVQDFSSARTDFLLLAHRDSAKTFTDNIRRAKTQNASYESILALIPLFTGAGVLANLLDMFRDAGLNMTSFISRPIKGRDGTYSFIVTADAAPWQPQLKTLMKKIIDGGSWVKTLAVYERPPRENPPAGTWKLPSGGVLKNESREICEKELLWD